MQHLIEQIREELIASADEKIRAGSQRFFKEPVKSHGVKTTTVSKISKAWFKKIDSLPKPEIYALCEKLWQSGYLEESFIACNWSYFLHKQYTPEDFKIFEKWLSTYVNNWASCDTLCNHTLGTFIEMYPEYIKKLVGFTRSDNRWMRRAAAVTLIIPARKGKFLGEIVDIADRLLLDQDDLVQKGYGWMLKAASEAYQQEIFDYVMQNKAVMPRTALRYAIEKMPATLRSRAMER